MAIVVNGLYIGCVVEATSTFNDFFDNKYGFTNFEAISNTHVTARYIQGILIFLLMIKVSFIEFKKQCFYYERLNLWIVLKKKRKKGNIVATSMK